MRIATIQVKPWGKGQGDFVEINADDFDPSVHKRLSASGVNASGQTANPLDHDGDGKPGGSLPKAARAKKDTSQ